MIEYVPQDQSHLTSQLGLKPPGHPASFQPGPVESTATAAEIAQREKRHRQFVEDAFNVAGRRLYIVQEILADAGDATREPALKNTVDWLYNFIMRPHPNLGRTGPVCPYVKPAIDEFLLYLTVARPEDPHSIEAIHTELNLYRKVFARMAPRTGPLSELRCILILFPQTPEAVFDNPRFLKDIKDEMLMHDIMIGQFFPTGNIANILKSKFFPVQPAAPMYVMRSFIKSDIEFLKNDKDWVRMYQKRFGRKP